jgi:predicted enzyme related to lactoylglutathione lyase
MLPPNATPVVHLELHTPAGQSAEKFYEHLCRWQPERVQVGDRDYHALELAPGLGGGIVECATPRSLWLPYVEVTCIHEATEQAQRRVDPGGRPARPLAAEALTDRRVSPRIWLD